MNDSNAAPPEPGDDPSIAQPSTLRAEFHGAEPLPWLGSLTRTQHGGRPGLDRRWGALVVILASVHLLLSFIVGQDQFIEYRESGHGRSWEGISVPPFIDALGSERRERTLVWQGLRMKQICSHGRCELLVASFDRGAGYSLLASHDARDWVRVGAGEPARVLAVGWSARPARSSPPMGGPGLIAVWFILGLVLTFLSWIGLDDLRRQRKKLGHALTAWFGEGGSLRIFDGGRSTVAEALWPLSPGEATALRKVRVCDFVPSTGYRQSAHANMPTVDAMAIDPEASVTGPQDLSSGVRWEVMEGSVARNLQIVDRAMSKTTLLVGLNLGGLAVNGAFWVFAHLMG